MTLNAQSEELIERLEKRPSREYFIATTGHILDAESAYVMWNVYQEASQLQYKLIPGWWKTT